MKPRSFQRYLARLKRADKTVLTSSQLLKKTLGGRRAGGGIIGEEEVSEEAV